MVGGLCGRDYFLDSIGWVEEWLACVPRKVKSLLLGCTAAFGNSGQSSKYLIHIIYYFQKKQRGLSGQ